MPQNLSTNQTSRIVWLDVLRLFAIFMVICIHCSDPFNVSPEARSNPEFNRWGSIYGSFLRPCVPLFVMITGILLLPVKMSFEDFYKKRLLRIAFPFLLWSVLYNLFPWITGVLGLPQTLISDVFAQNFRINDINYLFHSFCKMAYCIVFSYLGVPSGFETKETNSTKRPSLRMPSFSQRRWLAIL